MEILARAKINLTLDIVGRRPDGYHDIESIMHQVALADEVSVNLVGRPGAGVEVVTDSPEVPGGSCNLAHRAASAFLSRVGARDGVSISIRKNIPAAAGLAGGSADAAAVLVALNSLLGSPLGDADLRAVGQAIGADVPFCIVGGAALARGTGEVLTPVPPLSGVPVVLVRPKVAVPTREVYRLWNAQPPRSLQEQERARHATQVLVEELGGVAGAGGAGQAMTGPHRNGSGPDMVKAKIKSVCSLLFNVLEVAAAQLSGEISAVRRGLLEAGACGACMTGSGPTVFGFFPSGDAAAGAAEVIRATRPECEIILTGTVAGQRPSILE
ncbi:MAG: 4-(cytidine 5'-diphospho)-2-C-methyl-D-erythritol kinase [Firmicutes bacterium]|jgi:4-diphosphocytidyl-2-C-methyl-D-erythritol kinase|nr:4-(cytidine 5'-diphospho)-2-C-methyl-D-erythritol kinase [Bacillota bacterium]